MIGGPARGASKSLSLRKNYMEENIFQKFISGFITSKKSLSTKAIITLIIGIVSSILLALLLEGVLGVSAKEGDSLGTWPINISFLYVCWMVFLHSFLKWNSASDRTRIFIKSLILASIIGLITYFLAGIGIAIIASLISVIGGMLFLKS